MWCLTPLHSVPYVDVFTAADKPPSAASNVALVCDDGRSCSVAGSADAATAESFSVATVASD